MRVLIFLLLSIFSLLIPHWVKPNFKIPPIHEKKIPFNAAWETAPPDEKILLILNQPFTYLAHGNQSTAFISEDGRYVLKLFRYPRSRFPLVQKLKAWTAKIVHRKPKKNDLYGKVSKTFTAAYLAYAEASAFTQVLFCHLNLTENQLPIIQLKAGRTYRLPLDSFRFVLQKKVTPFAEALLSAKKEPKRMHQLIDSLVDLLICRSALGIRNSDPNLAPNFGFLETQAVEVDFGNYRKAPQTRTELVNYFNRFEHWLSQNAPEYLFYLKDLRSNLEKMEERN